MRREHYARLDKLAVKRRRTVSQLSDEELHQIIRGGIEDEGGTEIAAATCRVAGDEDRALFIEFYMAGDDRWEQHIRGDRCI